MADIAQPRPPRPLFLRSGVLALVIVGGAVGTTVRALLEDAFATSPGDWPWTTFGINVVGSFLLGLLVTVLAGRGSDEGGRRLLRLGLGTGVLGGFTTYSTFIVETDGLLRDGHFDVGATYAVVSVALGIAAAGLGMLFGGAARPPVIDPEVDA